VKDSYTKYEIQSKEEIVGNISKETFKFIGIALYWAEGSKGKGLRITNSDPYLILFITAFKNTPQFIAEMN